MYNALPSTPLRPKRLLQTWPPRKGRGLSERQSGDLAGGFARHHFFVLQCLVLLALLLVPVQSTAVTLRYGIVVGNNRGMDADHSELPELQHAESEAQKLHQRLIKLANFDPTPQRTRLLLGATRAQLKRAVAEVAAIRQEDLKTFKQANTLFAFFFTGHGLQERLLLNDGPLTAAELGPLFAEVGADFTIGFFDACFSGSLDNSILTDKGIRAAPGLNIFKELPEEILAAEGSIWFVSSGPTQASYEDRRIGGIFTHYFSEALEKAELDGPGITLDRIWAYARQRTVTHAAKQQRQQHPQQYVARLKLKGPLYFSFPRQRSSVLVLEKQLHGKFLLHYAGGQLTEAIIKKAGQRATLAVFPGEARLLLLRGDQVMAQEDIELKPSSRLILHNAQDFEPVLPVGFGKQVLWEKGLADERLAATQVREQWNLMLGLSYGFAQSIPGVLLPQHQAQLAVRSDVGRWVLAGRLGYAGSAEQLDTWSYQVHGAAGQASLGYAWDLGPVRLSLSGAVAGNAAWQAYDDGAGRFVWLLQPHAQLALLLPRFSSLLFEVMLTGGALWAPGTGIESTQHLRGYGGFALAAYYRFL